ncbi:helix-turn-helix transcriptional regulator [Streptomyces sp. NPDC003032]
MEQSSADSEFDRLDDTSAEAYRLAVLEGQFRAEAIAAELNLSPEDVQRTERVLRVLRLLHPTPGDPRRLAPVSPDAASSELLGPMEQHMGQLEQHVSRLRSQLSALQPIYFEGRRLRNHLEAFDTISDPDIVQSMIDSLIKRSKYEVLTVQPGGARPPHLLESAKQSCLAIVERGVRLRSIYQHTARTDPGTQALVREVSAEGGEFRTSEEVIDRLIVIDREVAFLPQRKAANGVSGGAVVAREPTLVNYLCSVHDLLWRSAVSFLPDDPSSKPVMDDVKRAIIRLLAEGYKDELVARRLGMSVRTCRRHISEITAELKAASRFQAGVKAATYGLFGPVAPTT